MGDLQKQLYNRFLEIQNIDPTGLLIFWGNLFLYRIVCLAGLNTAKLFADYQYLMKIWTVRNRCCFIDEFKEELRSFSIHGYYDPISSIDGKNDRRKIAMKQRKSIHFSMISSQDYPMRKYPLTKNRRRNLLTHINDHRLNQYVETSSFLIDCLCHLRKLRIPVILERNINRTMKAIPVRNRPRLQHQNF